MYKYREDRVEAGDVEQDKDQPADERLGHVGEDGVADEDAQHERRQQIDALAEGRRNRQAAELIARQEVTLQRKKNTKQVARMTSTVILLWAR